MIRVIEDLRSLLDLNVSLPLEAAWTRTNQGSGTQRVTCLSSHRVIKDMVLLSDRAVSLPSKAVENHANEGSRMLHSVRLMDTLSLDGIGLVQAI